MDATELDKYLYIRKTPTWLIRGFYAFGIASWLLVVYAFSGLFFIDPFFRWFVAPLLFFLTIYQVCNYALNLFYTKFSIAKHETLKHKFWSGNKEPSVDIFLPWCGESIDIVRNTWNNVLRLNYKNKRVYVLDDSREDCDAHKELAESHGFTYLSRPNKGWMKKAGNLQYAFQRTHGEFIVIFDADFAPHPDFITELLPYMSDPKVAIVQSPQYFQMSKAEHQKSPLAYGAAYVQEAFYRFIQVVRDRFNSVVCCGSNALYRRSALNEVDGVVLNDHGEDLHTGFALTSRGWVVRYIPIILAVGLCPDNAQVYFHQQSRWCYTTLMLITSRDFWRSPLPWKSKISYMAGFLYYLQHPVSILFSFQLFWTLFFYNPYITFMGGVLFYPYLIWGFTYMLPGFAIARFYWGCFYASLMQLYSYSHSIFTALARQTVGWIPSNTKQMGVSPAFRQCMTIVGVYLFLYSGLVAIMIGAGKLHPLNYNYYSVQFWVIWNFGFSILLLWQMYRTTKEVSGKWPVKGATLYLGLLFGMFTGIMLLV